MQLNDAGQQVATRPAPNATVSPGYFNNAPASSPPTIVDADFLNAVTAELLQFLTLTSQAASKLNVAQVATAVLMLCGCYGIDSGGTANAYVVSPLLSLPALQDGMPVRFWTARVNTGAATLQLSPLSAFAIKSNNGGVLGANAIRAGLNEVFWNTGLNCFVTLGGGGGTPPAWVLLPGGQFLQWGTANVTVSAGYGQTTVVFPQAFPNGCLQVVASDDGAFTGLPADAAVYGCSGLSTTSFVLTAATPGNLSESGSSGARYIAIGY